MRIQEYKGTIKLWLSAKNTYDWANRVDESWPCFQLAGKRLFAEFAPNGDLVDIAIDGQIGDCDPNEFCAITSDFIRTRHPNHPSIV